MAPRRPGEGGRALLLRALVGVFAVAIVAGAAMKLRAATTAGPPPAVAAPEAPAEGSMHAFTMKTIDGEDRPLSAYLGRVTLVVNTASECGYTPQYAGLQRIHERFQPRGFSVLGVPSNDFGGQEPGADAEIEAFCATRFGVTFPLFSKVAVHGPSKHPLYEWLTRARGGDVKWNFTKFLVGKDGRVIERFEPNVEPEDPALIAAIERALGA